MGLGLIYCCYTGFHWVLLGVEGFYGGLVGLVGFCWDLLGLCLVTGGPTCRKRRSVLCVPRCG